MSEQTTEEIEREEIEMLLPWYVTGKLDRTDAARVESYLARHPRLAAQLDLIRAERDETVLANEALGRPSALGLPAGCQAVARATHRPERAVPAGERFLRRPHGARRAMGQPRRGGAHCRASRSHHQSRRP